MADTRIDPLSPAERVAICAMSQLAFEWHFRDKADALMSVLREALPGLRRDADFNLLADAAAGFFAASTPLEWTHATLHASRAILPILRRDMNHALQRLAVRG